MPELIATKSMRYATRMLTAGEPFQASNRDARLLIAIKRAKLSVNDAREQVGLPPVEETPVETRAEVEAQLEVSVDDLREQAEALGVDVDKRWGEKRLKDEIAKAAHD